VQIRLDYFRTENTGWDFGTTQFGFSQDFQG